MPEDIETTRDAYEAAMLALVCAQDASDAADSECEQARNRAHAAELELNKVAAAEQRAHEAYLNALRAHGYKQTADGPKPASVLALGPVYPGPIPGQQGVRECPNCSHAGDWFMNSAGDITHGRCGWVATPAPFHGQSL